MTVVGYVPIATISELGGVIPDGTSIFITADGIISVDPAQLIPIPGTEGDLYYFHDGAVHQLHIGAAGKVLTSDGLDPAWLETVLPMAADGVLKATRHTLDIASTTSIGVVLTDDAIGDAGHYFLTVQGIGNVPIPAPSCTVIKSTNDSDTLTAKCFNVSGSPPAGWFNLGFDDSAWATGLHSPDGPNYVISATHEGPFASVVLRDHFTITNYAGLDHGVVSIKADHVLDALYINGTSVTVSGGTPNAYSDYVIPRSLLVLGDNLIGAEWTNDNDAFGAVGYNISACTGSLPPGLALPVCSEGAIWYEHSGNPTCLPIGAAFTVLQSNGAGPLYDNVPLQVLLSGTLEAVRGILNFIPGANTAITVADDPAHKKVDVTIASSPVQQGAVAQSGHVSITITAGTASNTATVTFNPAFASAPDVIVSSESGLVIASAESISRTGFTARLTANVPLAPGTSITATLHWTVGGPTVRGKFKPPLLRLFR